VAPGKYILVSSSLEIGAGDGDLGRGTQHSTFVHLEPLQVMAEACGFRIYADGQVKEEH
jgi:hypothetical protein